MTADSNTLRAALAAVETLLRAQEAKGREKYPTDLDGANLSAAQLLQHAQEETADLLMYLTALLSKVAELESENERWRGAFRRALGISNRPLTEAELVHAELLATVDWSDLGATEAP